MAESKSIRIPADLAETAVYRPPTHTEAPSGRESLLRAKSIVESVVAAYNGNATDRIAGPIYALEEVNNLIGDALNRLESQEVRHG